MARGGKLFKQFIPQLSGHLSFVNPSTDYGLIFWELYISLSYWIFSIPSFPIIISNFLFYFWWLKWLRLWLQRIWIDIRFNPTNNEKTKKKVVTKQALHYLNASMLTCTWKVLWLRVPIAIDLARMVDVQLTAAIVCCMFVYKTALGLFSAGWLSTLLAAAAAVAADSDSYLWQWMRLLTY